MTALPDLPSTPDAWRASAAYLYVLQLNRAGLAWEYLRRNPAYERAWRAYRRSRDDAPAHAWGLQAFEDPGCDARDAMPLWGADLAGNLLALPVPYPGASFPRLSIWRLPGHKRIDVARHRLVLRYNAHGRIGSIQLPINFDDGTPCALTGLQPGKRLRGSSGYPGADEVVEDPAAAWRAPGRDALAHFWTLQMLDGDTAGATHRQLADALSGAAAVQAAEEAGWHADSALRARVRHLLKRGRMLVDGGYSGLLAHRGGARSQTSVETGGRRGQNIRRAR